MQAKIWNNSGWMKITNPEELKIICTGILRNCGFNILQVTEYHFEPQGYTALWLLSESHFAIHTFPEFGCSYFELSSCNLEYYQKFIKLTKDWNNI